MSSRGLATAIAVVAGLAGGAAAQHPVYRLKVDLVPIAVTVTDSNGRFITDLGADDFMLYENGVAQEIAVFDHARTPVALALLVDASGSMEQHMASAKRAAEGLLGILRPGDVASVHAFANRSRVLQDFTPDVAALRGALHSIEANGATTLYDSLYIAVEQGRRFVEKAPEVPRRHVVVVLSDGKDTSSLLSLDDVVTRVRESGAVVYTIRLKSPTMSRFDGARGSDEFALKQMADRTGGRAFFVLTDGELAAAYAQIARELTSQYVLAYTAQPTAERWRRIEVRVKREGSTIRTREGYAAQ